ncbi:MAG: hypothetical protein GC171_08655 [Terrimonas sp.]|nr:hypothetical protein [Terrimonas sp.]
MRKMLLAVLALPILFSCNNHQNLPDISGIKVSIPFERFEKVFFANDSNDIAGGLSSVSREYPDFYPDFMQQILGVSGRPDDANTQSVTLSFLRGYTWVYDTLSQMYRDITPVKAELEKSFRYLKYYFPEYQTGKAITFIGPFDAPGVALTRSGLAIGLQQYAGRNFSIYHSTIGEQLFPTYISRRFEPQYISTNCIRAVLNEMFPDHSSGKPLVEQIIEKGKQWYALDKVLPGIADSIKTGYTTKQLEWCAANEGEIWSFVLQNENLNSIEPVVIQTYIGESPFTQGMPEVSPGNIGQWIGWQIVKKYAESQSSLSLKAIMQTDARKILDEAKYKPK